MVRIGMSPSLVLTEDEKKERFKKCLRIKEKQSFQLLEARNMEDFLSLEKYWQNNKIEEQLNVVRKKEDSALQNLHVNFNPWVDQKHKNPQLSQTGIVPNIKEFGEKYILFDRATNVQVGEVFMDKESFWPGDFQHQRSLTSGSHMQLGVDHVAQDTDQLISEKYKISNTNILSEYNYNSNSNILHMFSETYNEEDTEVSSKIKEEDLNIKEKQTKEPNTYLHKKFGKWVGNPIRL